MLPFIPPYPASMEKWPPFYGGQMGVPGSDTPLGHRMASRSMVYYVDKTNPDANNANDGTDPRYPKLTIQSAINAHNALINWVDAFGGLRPFSTIYIGPGEYVENLTPAYFCHIIGLGQLGTDTATEVHPVTGSALAGTGLGLHLCNIKFESETAVPVIDFGICNNTIIEHCEITKGIAGLATIGIEFDNASHVRIIGNDFLSGVADFATGLRFNGGANKFAHQVRVIGNVIYAATTGIHIAADCTASGMLIAKNTIARPTTGINDLSALSYCVENWVSAGTNAIVHAASATRCIANHVIDNAVGGVLAVGTT